MPSEMRRFRRFLKYKTSKLSQSGVFNGKSALIESLFARQRTPDRQIDLAVRSQVIVI
jgi:hypothetical protein